MIPFIAIAITSYLVFACARVVAHFWGWFAETRAHEREQRLLGWFAKGVLIPIAIWIGFNFVLAPGHVVSMDDIVVSKMKTADWVYVLCWLTLPAALVAGSFWAAATLSWLVVHLVANTDSRREILGAGIFWGLLLFPIAGIVLYYFGGWYAGGVAMLVVLTPVLRDLLALGTPRDLAPAYSRAIERIKGGKYAAAEMEVIRQLQRREDDFEGWMLLAQLYAKHFGDLAEAERTVREVCRQKTLTKTEYCNAFLQLADWHLNIGKDGNAAFRVWMEICETYPHSQAADVARRKINELNAPHDNSTA
jgi:hypothetical protein